MRCILTLCSVITSYPARALRQLVGSLRAVLPRVCLTICICGALLATLPLASAPVLAVPPDYDEGGPGWDEDNFASAFLWENWRGKAPECLEVSGFLARAVPGCFHELRGSKNFTFTVPILHQPGRGLGLDISLTYNSKTWQLNNKGDSIMFEAAGGLPAAGWWFSFGALSHVYRFEHIDEYMYTRPDGGSVRLKIGIRGKLHGSRP